MIDDSPSEGALAYRSYQVTDAAAGAAGRISITLGRPAADTLSSRFAAHVGAEAYGLISIVGLDDVPVHPVICLWTEETLGIATLDESDELNELSKHLVAHYLAVFFSDIGPIAPELKAVRAALTGPTLH